MAKKTAKPRLERVRFKYKFDESFNPVYINGAHGSVTPQQELSLSFFMERGPLPYEELFSVSNDGRIGNKLGEVPAQPDGEASLIRFISTGVVMSPDVARRVRDLIDRLLTGIEQRNAKKKELAPRVSPRRTQGAP